MCRVWIWLLYNAHVNSWCGQEDARSRASEQAGGNATQAQQRSQRNATQPKLTEPGSIVHPSTVRSRKRKHLALLLLLPGCLLPAVAAGAGMAGTVSIGSIITTKPPLSPAITSILSFSFICPRPCVWIRFVSIKTDTHNREYDRSNSPLSLLQFPAQNNSLHNRHLVLRALLRT